MSVLVIEDNQQDRALVHQALHAIGIDEIQSEMDGGHAIELLSEKIRDRKPLPGAIVLDLNLPLVSGHEVLRFCKRTPELRGTKVIVLSRLTSENEIQVCYYMGASRYIHKTSDPEELQHQLRSAFGDGNRS